MSAAATYKILDWIEGVDSEVFLYISGDNMPERAAVKFRNMLNIYNTDQSASPADAFIASERISPFNPSFRDSHEQDEPLHSRLFITDAQPHPNR